jgi:hypothetical protein
MSMIRRAALCRLFSIALRTFATSALVQFLCSFDNILNERTCVCPGCCGGHVQRPLFPNHVLILVPKRKVRFPPSLFEKLHDKGGAVVLGGDALGVGWGNGVCVRGRA